MFDLKPIERKVDCAFEESEHQTQCETGVNGRAKCHLRLLCQGAVMGVSNHSFDRQGSIESVG
jgi:hypothetical protein